MLAKSNVDNLLDDEPYFSEDEFDDEDDNNDFEEKAQTFSFGKVIMDAVNFSVYYQFLLGKLVVF